jgi:tyrosyl-tRNA synthetase
MDSPTGVPDAVDLSGSMAAMQLAEPPMSSPGGDDAVDLPQRVESVSSSSVSVAVDLPDSMLQERYATLRSIAEECIEDEELLNLLRIKPNPICYDGFEPSGRMHIAQVQNLCSPSVQFRALSACYKFFSSTLNI